MHLSGDPHPRREAALLRARSVGTWRVLAVLVVACVGFSVVAHAQHLDRWRRGHSQAGEFRAPRFGPNAHGLNASRPNVFEQNRGNAVEPGNLAPNQRLATPEERREAVGGAVEGRGEPDRPPASAVERGGAEFPRPNAGPGLRTGPSVGQRGLRGAPFGGRVAGDGFTRRAFAERNRQGPAGFGHGPFAGRFQGRFASNPLASLVPRRPLIGERGFTGAPPVGETRFLTNEMVFHVPPNVSPQAVDTLARRLNLSTVATHSFSLSGGTLFRFRITDGRPVADVIHALESENIGVAQPNYVFRLQQDATLAARNGTGDPTQYVVGKLRLVDVHRIAIGSNVPLAVIDSEIDGRHPELAGAVVEEFDAIGNHDKPHAHGTGMAGAIAAHRKLVGVAPGVRILAIHAFSSNGNDSAEATSEHILAGIDWAIRKGARIINMSFAGPDDPMLQMALQKARDRGIILIAAAGNMGPKSPPLYPAADPNAIAVTASDANDQVLPQANQGPYVAIAAPGVDILEPAPSGGYQVTTGTSVAAAHVSGIVALLLEHDPKLDANAVRDLLTASAKHHTPKGRDDQFGYGIVDPYAALTAADPKVARDRSHDLVTPSGTVIPRPVSVR